MNIADENRNTADQRNTAEQITVAYSGIEGAFAQLAVNRIFPKAAAIACKNFRAAYSRVESGQCDYAVLPIENSFAGEVTEVMDLAFFGPLYVQKVYQMEIHQNLLVLPGTCEEQITTVLSHPQALSQCMPYLEQQGWEIRECVNTAVAAEAAARGQDPSIAAIASEETAKLYGLSVLKKNINENQINITRFAVFSREQPEPVAEANHFLMFFTVDNRAGALGRAVSIIGESGFNLKALRSRPTKQLVFSYYFYAEGEGNLESPMGQRMRKQLEECTTQLRVLGSYQNEETI